MFQFLIVLPEIRGIIEGGLQLYSKNYTAKYDFSFQKTITIP